MVGVHQFPKIKKLRFLNPKIYSPIKAYLNINIFNYHQKLPKLKFKSKFVIKNLPFGSKEPYS